MITKIVSFILFLTFFMSFKMNGNEKSDGDYEIIINQIVDNFAKKIIDQYGLVWIGSGGRMPNDIEEVSVKFMAHRKGTIKEARELQVKGTELLLETINSNKKIRPYLKEYPFKANRAEVSIAFRKNDNSCYTDGSVVYVFQVKNIIRYFSEDPLSNNRILLKEEPYEEALKIVRNAK